jgi:hypothetical protein
LLNGSRVKYFLFVSNYALPFVRRVYTTGRYQQPSLDKFDIRVTEF